MKTTTFLLALVMIFTGLDAFSQKLPQTERGDRAFEKFDFSRAIVFYEIAHEKTPEDPYITRQMALAYENMGDAENTAFWFGKTLELDDSNPQDMLKYAQALKKVEKYEEAMTWFEKYHKLKPESELANNHLEDKRYFVDLMEDSVRYDIKKLAFNNDNPAFGFTSFENSYIFSSAGVESALVDEKNPWNDLPYLDLYECELGANNELVDIRPLEGAVNSRFHDGPACYDPSTKTLYITRNNMEKGKPVRDETGTVNLKIYETTFTESGWSEVRELNFNSDEYSNGHPTISADGKEMYFVSNRPGGFGGTDIYRTEKNGNSWGEPENLGSTVNSEGDEMFPFIADDNSLYFASTGHVGLGGLDLFRAMKEAGKWTEPKNLGYPVNSSGDDFSVFYNLESHDGYFASNRGKKGDNIYYFESKQIERKIIAGKLETNELDRSLAGQKIVMENMSTGEREDVEIDKMGRFRVEMKPQSDYKLMILPEEETAERVQPREVFTQKLSAEIDDPYEDIGVLAIPEAVEEEPVAELVEPETEEPIEEEVEEPEEIEEEPIEEVAEEPVEEEAPEESKDVEDVSHLLAAREIEQIYFGFDKAKVRKQDVDNMNRLVDLMREDETYQLVITCHTDSRGSRAYNEKLSKRRAEATRAFLLEHGIDESRIEISWKGEDDLANHCADGITCSATEHMRNRRGEFTLLKSQGPAL
ncbi:OmpA family protein [Halocola ammonii]